MRLRIRTRLTLAFALVLAVTLVAAGVFVSARFRADADRAVDAELRARAATFFAAQNPDPHLLVDLLGVSDEHFGQLLDRAGTVIASSPQVTRRPFAGGEPGLRDATVPTRTERRNVRLLVTRRGARTLVLASALDDRDEALANLRRLLLLGGAGTYLVAVVLAWLLAGAALRPVERLRAEAAGYSAADLAGRLAVPAGDDELHRLASTLNEMLERIQESFERQRAFVDDASHELRTPLANLSLELELAQRRGRSADELRSAVAAAAHEVDRLDRLASDLLVLARTTDGRLPVAPVPTDVDALVRDTVESFRARADLAAVELRTDGGVGRPVLLDPIRVRQALTNLLDNALRVSPAGGQVTVASHLGDHELRLAVSDGGPGFPPDLTESAFAMFVRGPAATVSTDGAGLGLAVVAAVADAHGGRAFVDAGGPGATVVLEIPAGAVP